jgi:ADP-dependent NAD(P)H-hydrate dehydratase
VSPNVRRVESVVPLAPRAADAHKGTFGRVLIVGGSRGMPGAMALASLAALRGGAGLVTFAVPEAVQLTVAGLCPCATSVPLSCDAAGLPTPPAAAQVRRYAEAADVLAVGPGMAVGGPQKNIVRLTFSLATPLVIDADGLNNLVDVKDWPALRTADTVLTPHPGEMARLTGRTVSRIQADREAAAVLAVGDWREASTKATGELICVLKGHRTVVTDAARVYVNDTGNPGMATGGSGDVLTGLIAGLAAQGMKAFEAAAAGAFLHGMAGDIASRRLGVRAMIPSDIIDCLGEAFKTVEKAAAG